MSSLPTGSILIWSGAVVDIPAGYALCDGNNGTPDLRDRFVIGAGLTYNPGDIGGSATHTHTFTTNGHTHEPAGEPEMQAGSAFSDNINPSTDSGTTDPGSSLPPYYALCFVMKV
jgi:hypothetical protein